MQSSRPFCAYGTANAERVSDALCAYVMRRDFEPAAALCHPTVVWRSVASPEHAPFGGTFLGPAGVRDFFRRMLDGVDITAVEVMDVIPAGEDVVHVLRISTVARDGSSSGTVQVVGRWTFRDGLVTAYTDYFDVASAIQVSSDQPHALRVTLDPSFAIYRVDQAVALAEALAAYKRGDDTRILAFVDEDTLWTSVALASDLPQGGVRKGPAGVKAYFDAMRSAFTISAYDVTDIIPAGAETVHIAEVRGVYRPKQAPYQVRLVCFCAFRNGRLASYTEYYNAPAVLAQIGLRS